MFCFPLSFCLLVIIIISQVKPHLTHWTRQLSNRSSAAEVMGKREREKGGQIKEVKDEKEAHGLAFFLQQTSLSASPSALSSYPSSPVKPFLFLSYQSIRLLLSHDDNSLFWCVEKHPNFCHFLLPSIALWLTHMGHLTNLSLRLLTSALEIKEHLPNKCIKKCVIRGWAALKAKSAVWSRLNTES